MMEKISQQFRFDNLHMMQLIFFEFYQNYQLTSRMLQFIHSGIFSSTKYRESNSVIFVS
jgi:hypothetical protein